MRERRWLRIEKCPEGRRKTRKHFRAGRGGGGRGRAGRRWVPVTVRGTGRWHPAPAELISEWGTLLGLSLRAWGRRWRSERLGANFQLPLAFLHP